MKVNSWVKRIRRSSSFQAEGWRRTSAASVSSLVAQWHGERGFLHHHSPGFLVLWTHEAASGRNGSSGTQKVQCTVTAVFCFGREGGKGGRRRLSPQSHLLDLPLCEHCCAPDMTRSIPSATGTTWNEFPGAVCHTVLNTTTGLATCRGIIRGTDKILATLLAASPCVVVKGRAKEQTPLRSCIGALDCALCSRGSPCVCSPTALLVASETWFVIKQKH